MSTYLYTSPRKRLNALWASSMEASMQQTHPEMSLTDIRTSPMMQGVYKHLQAAENGEVLSWPDDWANTSQVDRYALLSQEFMGLGTFNMFMTVDESLYDKYIALVQAWNDSHNTRDFSTKDYLGFGLCLILWAALVMGEDVVFGGWKGKALKVILDALMKKLPFTEEQMQQIDNFINQVRSMTNPLTLQYRDALSYPSYQALTYKLPNDARIIMLGDWGTSLEDAHDLLQVIWEKVYNDDPNRAIVFMHLGDIYYAGLPVECTNNFLNVFRNVGATLQQKYPAQGSRPAFNPNVPIFTIPGNHEYYSYGYGYYQLLDTINNNVTMPSGQSCIQKCSFFCVRTTDGAWQFLGMDTGQDDYNALESLLQAGGDMVLPLFNEYIADNTPWWMQSWLKKWAREIYQEVVGPFEPVLRSSEISWHKARLNEFNGQTVLLSHHQLYSAVAEIDHNSPEYMNKSLLNTFRSYFKKQIAAWYWGHEHTYAIYQDGLFGLNKGRLLGSSSYEASDSSDTPYSVKYPQVRYTPNMRQADQQNGFYEHACAVFDLKRSKTSDPINVTYYEYPSWGQEDSKPTNAALAKLYSEQISNKYATTVDPTWAGNGTISSGNIDTKQRPAMAVYNNILYMVYKDANSDKIRLATSDLSKYDPGSGTAPKWTDLGAIAAYNPSSKKNENLNTDHSPALTAIQGGLVMVFKNDNGNDLQCAYFNASTSKWTKAGDIMVDPSNNGGSKINTANSPALTTFRGVAYLLYANSDDSKNLWWASYELPENSSTPDSGTWHSLKAISDGGTKAQTNSAPAITSNLTGIYMTYQKYNDDEIRWGSYTAANGWKLHGDAQVYNASQKKNVSMQCHNSMGLQADQDWLYMVFTANDGNGSIYWAVCYIDPESPNLNTWVGNSATYVASGKNTGTPQTQSAPALVIGRELGLMTYASKSSSDIRQAFF